MFNLSPQVQAEIRKRTGWVIVLSILLILLGLFAALMPIVATLISTSIFGWIFLIAGVIRIVKSFQARPIRGFWLSLLVGILYVVAGLVILANLLQGAVALTFALALVFVVEGILEIIACFKARTGGNLSWLVLIDGLFTLILGILVWNGWPDNSLWLLGFYVGISLAFSGVTLLAIATATRKTVSDGV